jgi:large subunit ribosomal protein L32
VPALGECPNCREPKLLHRACPNCGYYNGRSIIIPKEAK